MVVKAARQAHSWAIRIFQVKAAPKRVGQEAAYCSLPLLLSSYSAALRTGSALHADLALYIQEPQHRIVVVHRWLRSQPHDCCTSACTARLERISASLAYRPSQTQHLLQGLQIVCWWQICTSFLLSKGGRRVDKQLAQLWPHLLHICACVWH